MQTARLSSDIDLKNDIAFAGLAAFDEVVLAAPASVSVLAGAALWRDGRR